MQFFSFGPLCRAERSRHHMPTTLGLGSVRALPLQFVFDLCLSPPFLSKCMESCMGTLPRIERTPRHDLPSFFVAMLSSTTTSQRTNWPQNNSISFINDDTMSKYEKCRRKIDFILGWIKNITQLWGTKSIKNQCGEIASIGDFGDIWWLLWLLQNVKA